MEKSKFEAALQITTSTSKGGHKFMQLCDQIRSSVTPTDSYPGFMSTLSSKVLDITCQVLREFTSCIFSKCEAYGQEHFSRAVDALNKASLAYAIIYTRTSDDRFFSKSFQCIEDAVNFCHDMNLPECDAQYCASASFNIGAFIFSAKEYANALQLFKVAISISSSLKMSNLEAKSYRLKAQCLLAVGSQETDEFLEAVRNSDDNLSILTSWVSICPPKNPEIIAQFLKKAPEGVLVPYFVLHGYLNIIPKDSVYLSVYPGLQSPRIVLIKEAQKYEMCNAYFKGNMFLECKNDTLSILKEFQTEKLTPKSDVALLFIYYWIVESFIALGKEEEALWYAIKMRKLFKRYPFTAGFATFLEMKCRLHSLTLEEMKAPPKLEFTKHQIYNWESISDLTKAVLFALDGSEECFIFFQKVFTSENECVKCEAFHYFISSSRYFNVYQEISEFEYICSVSNRMNAYYIYHKVIEYLIQEDVVNDFWRFEEPMSPPQFLLDDLKKAVKLAFGYSTLVRKILQLEALVVGNSNPITTAYLLTTSLSQSLDRFIPGTVQKQFKIPFPILSIAYFNVVGLNPCILFAIYYPSSKPLVVRIQCSDKLDSILNELAEIDEASSSISSSLSRSEWWREKKLLDAKIGDLLSYIENSILGIWKGIFVPILYKPWYSTAVSVLTTSLNDDPSLKSEINELLKNRYDSIVLKNTKKLPLSLILGKSVHRIPWESLPIVEKNEVAITRIPSLRLVALQTLAKTIPIDVDPRNSYFVLNPQGDLVSTEKTFTAVFKEFDWVGEIGECPNPKEVGEAIKNRDLYVYCGHGTGNEYFKYNEMIEDGLECKATMLLMGCRSAELVEKGESDPKGIILNFVAAGSGAIVGNLWNVTDRDIDRFLLDLLSRAVANGPSELEVAVMQARRACKLRYLTGAAPIIYGFPTCIKMTEYCENE